jgi:predicted permease
MYESMDNDFDGAVRPLAARDNYALLLVGRLRPGQTRQSVDGRLASLAAGLAQTYPAEYRDRTLIAHPLSRLSVSTSPTDDGSVAIPATLLLAMAAVVLLIAALNVANMTLARGAARRKEIAVRLALGGGRGAIVQQLFLEGLLLAILGGAAGLVLSYGGTTLFAHSISHMVPFELVVPAAPDARVLAATMGFCLLSTLLFGFLPALNLSRPSLISDLRASDNADAASGRNRLFSRRNLLVIAQVSLSLTLLTAAGLFIRGSSSVASADPGFSLDNRVLVEFDSSLAGYGEARGRQLYTALLARMQSLPGVESASLAATVPFGIVSLSRSVQPAGAASKPVNCAFNVVSADYFRTLGVPLLRGRTFDIAEASRTARPVVILDRLAAQRLWPDGDAIGKHIFASGGGDTADIPDLEVVGIAGNVREHIIGGDSEPHMYVPFGQQYVADMHIHLRTAPMGPDATARFLGTVRQEVRAADSALPVLGIKSLRTHVESSADYWLIQMGARMFSLFGGIALLLAVIGLYGVRAYSVARRTREIGIRMALGASAAGTQRMVLREGLQLMAAGGAVGLVLSLLTGRILSGLLFRVNGADPLVFSTAAVLLGGVSLLACYLPARRAARIDPMVALRWE